MIKLKCNFERLIACQRIYRCANVIPDLVIGATC